MAEESSSKRAGEKLEQDLTKKQKVDDDKEREDFQQCFELVTEEDVAIDVIPLATKPASIFDREDLEIYESWLKQSMGIQGQKKAIKECYGLLKIMTKQLKNPGSVGIKSFIRLFGITTAHIKVSVAQEERASRSELLVPLSVISIHYDLHGQACHNMEYIQQKTYRSSALALLQVGTQKVIVEHAHV
ncbi:hypothetical protein Tco_0900195 [Tanacetum coccineum]